MSDDVAIDLGAWRTGAQDMQKTAAEVSAAISELVGAAGDPRALGNQDIVGGIASAIYQGVLDYLDNCVGTLKESYDEHGGMMNDAADAFEQNENDNVALVGQTTFTRGD